MLKEIDLEEGPLYGNSSSSSNGGGGGSFLDGCKYVYVDIGTNVGLQVSEWMRSSLPLGSGGGRGGGRSGSGASEGHCSWQQLIGVYHEWCLPTIRVGQRRWWWRVELAMW